jgi:hypothetical protein
MASLTLEWLRQFFLPFRLLLPDLLLFLPVYLETLEFFSPIPFFFQRQIYEISYIPERLTGLIA